MQSLCTLDEARARIDSGAWLVLAGDESVLAALPRGNWIGGTIPYFMTPEGGLHSAERVFVTELPAGAGNLVKRYDPAGIAGIATDHPGHGFTLLLLPAFSPIHTAFAENVAEFPGIFDRPLVGWIAGVGLGEIGTSTPKVFDGRSGIATATEGIALHAVLPESLEAKVDIIDPFAPGTGPEIIFAEKGFTAIDVSIDGVPRNLAAYIQENGIDTRLPLVADYHGAMVNVSFQAVDAAAGKVTFYAPVFPDIAYRVAAPVDDYARRFVDRLPVGDQAFTFSCNCILNYVHAGLEGRSTGRLVGPMTFGEIAYMLLNQTAVYLTIDPAA